MFRNPQPLHVDDEDALGDLELDAFPIIDDFALTLVDVHEGGKHIEMASALLGRLAGFPAWDHAERDLRHFDPSDVPLGFVDDPYDDRDDAWRILIFEHAGFVHVLEGRAPHAHDFPAWFRVPTQRYFEAWAALIDTFNPRTVLEGEEEQV